jgi:uncharacterized peroxidase-related enzyme
VAHHGAALTRASGEAALTEAVASEDLGSLPPRLRVLCRYALRLTRRPDGMRDRDLEPMRRHGLSDRDIVDVNQVASYFNYLSRVANGLGVQLEEGVNRPGA